MTIENMVFEFNKDEVVNLAIVLGAGQFVIKSGENYKIETKGIMRNSFCCQINQSGTLLIKNKILPENIKVVESAIKNNNFPRVLITVPKSTQLENLKINLSAGSLSTIDLDVFSQRTIIDSTGGEILAQGITSASSNIRCSMGTVDVSGSFQGYTKVDCITGGIKITVHGYSRSYSCDSKIRVGTLKYKDEKRNAFTEFFNTEKKENHFFVKVGIGDVKIAFDK